MRCFVALPLPAAAREALAGALSPLRAAWPRLAWASSEGYHLTLAFLGEIGQAGLDCALRAVRSLAAGTAAPRFGFEFSFDGPACLPPRGEPRILYAALSESPRGASKSIWRLVNEALESEGRLAGLPPLNPEWGPGGRPFHAHLTLARRRPGSPFPDRGLLAATALPEGRWTVDSCHVYKSDLRPGGAVYTDLGGVELLPAGKN